VKRYFARWGPNMLKPYQTAQIKFEIDSEIGQHGRNSQTFLALDHQLNAKIAIKKIDKSKLDSPDEFFAESQALYASAHPNVVQIHYSCFDKDYIYVAMPYYKNKSVKDLIEERYLTVREIIIIGSQTLTGLHNIHSKNLIHFDIKPDNILLSDRREALISDFGLAKQMNFSGIAAQDRIYGKMLPPEATRGEDFEKTFDIYQFGLTLYRMCNGNEDFNAQFSKYGPPDNFDLATFKFDLRNGNFPNRSKFLPHIPKKLRDVIKKCLSISPKDRYQTAIEASNALAEIEGNHLDWQISVKPDRNIWTKNENGTEYELTIFDDSRSLCYKSTAGGDRRRVVAACKALNTDAKQKKFFADY